MKAEKWVFWIFLVCSAFFVIGSIVDLRLLETGMNFFVVPTLLLLYWLKAKKIFYPIVVVLLLLYIRDIFLLGGHEDYPVIILTSLILAFVILLLCAISMLQRTKVDPVEYLSFLIMYGFLIFVFVFFVEMVPELILGYEVMAYLYLLLLVLFMGISFTAYLLKSHWATLWLMVAASSFLFSELAMFFKLFILEDLSLNIFFPVFHVLAFYSLMQHALHRREDAIFSFL